MILSQDTLDFRIYVVGNYIRHHNRQHAGAHVYYAKEPTDITSPAIEPSGRYLQVCDGKSLYSIDDVEMAVIKIYRSKFLFRSGLVLRSQRKL